MDIIKTGQTWVICTGPILDVLGARLTGLTDIEFSVRRYTSGAWQWLDTADLTFRALPAGYQFAMTAVDATKAAGVYAYALDMSGVTNVALGDQLFIDIQQTTLTNAVNANQQGEGVYGLIIDKVEANLTVATSTLATSAALATAQGNITTILGFGAPPSAVAISTQVGSDITTAHGAGSYQTASTAGLATSTNVTDATTAINAHTDSAVAPLATTAQLGPLALEVTLTAMKGATFDTATDSLEALRNRGDAAWVTANISGLATSTNVTDGVTNVLAGIVSAHGNGSYLTASVAGLATTVQLDAHALAIKGATFNTLTDSLEAIRDRGDAAWVGSTAGDVATAVWVTAEGGAVGTLRYAITLLRKRQTNRRKMGVDGYELSYDDDNVTVLKKSLVKDINNDIVVPGAGDPSEVSQEVDP